MKKIWKCASFILAGIMALGLICPVLAANYHPHTITIKSENFGHTFEAYQIFKGDLSDDKLTNVEWGISIIDEEGLMNELKTIDAYVNCENAQDVARVLGELNNAQASDEFADIVTNIVTKYMYDAPVGSTNFGIENDDGLFHYTMTVAGDGYYLVKDRDGSVSGNDAYTKYILEVVKDVEVVAKCDYPTLEKKIVDTGSAFSNAAVGESVNFELTTFVPHMDGYNKYYFVITDTFSTGLSFNHDLVVTLGGEELAQDEDYTLEVSDDRFKLVFIDFIQYQEAYVNQEIIVTYSATVNEEAISGVNGNSNEAILTYSNNPNYDYQGENQPNTNEPVGNTPASKTYTYVADLVITKIDGNTNRLLSGAKFKITGENLGKVQIREDVYREDEAGDYYLLKDGSYTKAIPTSSTESLYASTTIKYQLSYETKYVDTNEEMEAIGIVDESGTLTFKGLKAGEYTITEIQAPAGYNKLENPIQVVIDWEAPNNGVECVWKINGDASINGITVKNYSGTTLPSTGGMGTTLFYLVGGLFVVVSFGLMKSKKKISSK